MRAGFDIKKVPRNAVVAGDGAFSGLRKSKGINMRKIADAWSKANPNPTIRYPRHIRHRLFEHRNEL